MPSLHQVVIVPARRRALLGTACALAVLGGASLALPAVAAGYPEKAIRIVVPYPTATVSDMVARLMATHMSKGLGQPIVVENVPAAGGVVGTQQLVRSPKDGYTLGILNNGHVINPSIFKDLGFDTLKDIEPVSMLGSSPLVLAVRSDLPARNMKELVDLAKAKPGQLTYGSMGNGTVVHLAGVMLAQEGKVDVKHVPYKSAAQLVSDVIGGQIDMAFFGVATAAAQVEGGKMRALGVTTQQRSPLLPAAPTFMEQGLANYNFDGWMAMVAPAGTPREIVERLNAEVRTALAQKDVQEAMAKIGVTLTPTTPDQAARFFRTELDKHSALAKSGGAKLD